MLRGTIYMCYRKLNYSFRITVKPIKLAYVQYEQRQHELRPTLQKGNVWTNSVCPVTHIYIKRSIFTSSGK
jgi:hypothetical protein